MAYDPATGTMILFGGGEGAQQRQEPKRHVELQRHDLGPAFRRPRALHSAGTPPWLTTPCSASWSSSVAPATMSAGADAGDVPLGETWTFQTAATGYRMVAADGGVFDFGAPVLGSMRRHAS